MERKIAEARACLLSRCKGMNGSPPALEETLEANRAGSDQKASTHRSPFREHSLRTRASSAE